MWLEHWQILLLTLFMFIGFWFFWCRNDVSYYFYIWQFGSIFFNMIKLIGRTLWKYAKPLCVSKFWWCISWLLFEAAEIIGQWIFVCCDWSQNRSSFWLVKSRLELIHECRSRPKHITLIIIVLGRVMTRPRPRIFVSLKCNNFGICTNSIKILWRSEIKSTTLRRILRKVNSFSFRRLL